MPAPPTKHRSIQPIYIISETIARHYGIPFSKEVITKSSGEQSKDMDKSKKSLEGTIELLKKPKRKCNILLIDDLFSMGSTLNECTRVLKKEDLVDQVYVLAITKTG